MSTDSIRKQYASLDVAKFICAILIIILHTSPFSSYSKGITFGIRNILTVVAVPLFFCISGFLFAEKLEMLQNKGERAEYLKKYLKRLLQIYVIWSLVYLPFVIIGWTRVGFEFTFILEYLKDFFLEGSFSTIWFLPALMIATAIVYLLRKRMKYRYIFLIGICLYLFTLLATSYYGASSRIHILTQIIDGYYRIFDSVKNGFLFGLIFVSLGGLIYEERWFEKIKIVNSIFGIILSGILLIGETIFASFIIGNRMGVDTMLSLIPVTIFLFCFIISIEIKPSPITLELRRYSMLLFLCQRIPLSIIEYFLPNTIIATNSMIFFGVVLVASFTISFVIIKLSNKFKFIKKIY